RGGWRTAPIIGAWLARTIHENPEPEKKNPPKRTSGDYKRTGRGVLTAYPARLAQALLLLGFCLGFFLGRRFFLGRCFFLRYSFFGCFFLRRFFLRRFLRCGHCCYRCFTLCFCFFLSRRFFLGRCFFSLCFFGGGFFLGCFFLRRLFLGCFFCCC